MPAKTTRKAPIVRRHENELMLNLFKLQQERYENDNNRSFDRFSRLFQRRTCVDLVV